MYNSPIEMIIGNMRMQQDGEIYRAVQTIGVKVDKEELLKALQYDRGQYEKGYEDGIKDGIKDFAEKLKTKIAGLEVKSPNETYKCGMEDVLYYRMPIIINNLVKEMTEESNDQQKT